MKKRVFCKSVEGRDLFFVDVYDIPGLNNIWLHFSMGKKVISTPDIDRLIRCAEERLVPSAMREHFIQEIFKLIREIHDIEQVFIPECLLNKDGIYCEETYNTLEDIYKDYIPLNFEPLTEISGYPFEEICGYLYLKSKQMDVIQLSESQFEMCALNSERLQSVYKYLKSSNGSYYNVEIKTLEESIEVYWMNSGGKTVLAFIVRIPN